MCVDIFNRDAQYYHSSSSSVPDASQQISGTHLLRRMLFPKRPSLYVRACNWKYNVVSRWMFPIMALWHVFGMWEERKPIQTWRERPNSKRKYLDCLIRRLKPRLLVVIHYATVPPMHHITINNIWSYNQFMYKSKISLKLNLNISIFNFISE